MSKYGLTWETSFRLKFKNKHKKPRLLNSLVLMIERIKHAELAIYTVFYVDFESAAENNQIRQSERKKRYMPFKDLI